MKLELCLYASLSSRLPDKSSRNCCAVDVAAGTSIAELLEQLKIPANDPKIIFVNGTHADANRILNDGDRLAVFPPIAGG
jgi:molybdopterin synthase sulfur carrier subunit